MYIEQLVLSLKYEMLFMMLSFIITCSTLALFIIDIVV